MLIRKTLGVCLLASLVSSDSSFLPSNSSAVESELVGPPRGEGAVYVDLSAFLPIRLIVKFVGVTLNPTANNTLRSDIIPAVTNVFQATLGVHRYLATVAVTGVNGLCNGIPVGSSDVWPGFTGDFGIYINTTGTGTTTLGTQSVCMFDAIRGNPLASAFILNKAYLETASRSDIYHEMMRLFGLALGFGSNTYQNAKKNGWIPYDPSEMFRYGLDDFNKTVRYLITPTVVARANQTFGADSYGVPITNKQDSIEWSYRAAMYDLWSDSPANMRVSMTLISLAFFQDLGWYNVNWTMGVNQIFGSGVPKFMSSGCVDSAGMPTSSQFCSGSDLMCDVSLLNKATCSKLNGTDSCPVAVATNTGSCLDPNNYNPAQDLEEFCPECRCFAGTHSRTLPTTLPRPLCHRVVCTATNAKIRIGDTLTDCSVYGGTISLQNLAGYVSCPPFTQLCPSYGCPLDCSGYGVCQQGKCTCDSGSFEDNCNSKLPPGIQSISGTTVTCIANAVLNPTIRKCDCKAGFYYDYVSRTCIACSPYCATCAYSAKLCLSCPASSNSALVGLYGTSCECNKGWFRNDVSGKCEACDSRCDTCVLGAMNCLTCKTSYIALANGQCICPLGTYQDTTTQLCKPCPVGCDSCISATVCTTCLPTLQLQTGKCSCQIGSYIDSTTNQCMKCHYSCSECATVANVCTKCATGLVLDPTYKLCVYGGFTAVKAWKLPEVDTLNTYPTIPIECVLGYSGRDDCKPLTKRGLWFDSSPAVFFLPPNKLSTTAFTLPSNFQFSLWVRPDDAYRDRCMISKVRRGSSDTTLFNFCISPTNTVYLTATMRSLDLATLGKESTIRIETVIKVLHDKWAPLKFKFESAIDYMNRPGTLVSLLINTMVYQLTFFPTVYFEDVLDGSDQRFVLGAQWLWNSAQNTFLGYMGEMAFMPAGVAYPVAPACGAAMCGGYGAALSNCGITETDRTDGSCGPNQT